MRRWTGLAITGLICAAIGFAAGRVSLPPPPVPIAATAPVAETSSIVATSPVAATAPLPPQPPAPAPAPPNTIAVAPASPPAIVDSAAPPAATPQPSGVRALTLMATAPDTARSNARACLVFSAPLATGDAIHPSDFIRIDPPVATAIQVDGKRLCLGGLAFGRTYKVKILAGLAGDDGSRTLADQEESISLGDLPARADFADDGFILPRDLGPGLPVATVNLSSVHMRIDRITDRVLARTKLGKEWTDNSGDDEYGSQPDTLGIPVWEGDLAVSAPRNQRTVTALPLARLLQPRLPGAYRIALLTKQPIGNGRFYDETLFRWVFDTDLMLTTHQGADGLHVFARSLVSARPVPGARVTLLAANNDILGEQAADANGEAVFAPGLARGTHGHAPRMLMAYLGDDFTALDLNKPGFDFADRGVDGRADPGPVDGFLYTDRGIYRPGESIDLTTIVRGRQAEPLPDGQAVTVTLRRPDGVEYGSWRLVPNAAGAAVQVIDLRPSVPRGTWRLEEALAGTKPLIGALSLQVQDFVPNRLAVEATADVPRLADSTPATVGIASRYLYGAPAAGLGVSAVVHVQADPHPIAVNDLWHFGRANETVNQDAIDIAGPATDARGQSALTIAAKDLKLPDTSLPLRAGIVIAVAEPGGRATETQLTLPIVTHPVLLGIKLPDAEGKLALDHPAAINAAAFAPDGKRLAGRARFRLIEQVTDWRYYERDGQWRWQVSTHDRPVTFGDIDLQAGGDGTPIMLPALQWGTYRLELSDAANAAFTSVILHAGWAAPSDAAESPEKVGVALTSRPPKAGGTATLHVKPPFAGEMLVTVENSRVLAVRTASVPAEGADITVQATQDWGAGAYVMASVYRPAAQAAGHAPVRAIGLAYVPLDQAAHTLNVAMAAPAVLRPRAHLDLPVTVSGALPDGGPVFLTVAAVDEGILQLTRFASPDPNGHFFGKRKLAVDVRDDYAHLIDGSGATSGEVRSGGDLDGVGLSVVSTRTTALFSGLVRVGADGRAVVPLDLPDFTGGLRLMAVAVSGQGFGHAEAQVPVRDPVVAQVSLPRFLAPGDTASLTLLAHNVEAPPGMVHIDMTATGALTMPPVHEDMTLAAMQSLVKTYPVSGGSPGIGQVALTLTDGRGLAIHHEWPMQVRSPFQSDTRVTRADQAPGAPFALTADLAQGFQREGATVRASYSSIGNIDLPGLLSVLDEYPFGCSEQLVSRAMPLLFVEQVAEQGLGVAPADIRTRVQDAIDRLLERQSEAGAFGLWRAGDGQATPYLGGQIIDFLMRARERGYSVPPAPLALARKALANPDSDQWMMHRYWWRGTTGEQVLELAGTGYSALLSARAGQADIGELRYTHDTKLTAMPALARAQLAVALHIMGDQARSLSAFNAAEAGLAQETAARTDLFGDSYGSRLRDTAAMVALATEAGDRPRTQRLLDALQRMDTRPEALNTQQQGWLVIAAGTLLASAGPVALTADGAALTPQPVVTLRRDLAALGAGISIVNSGPTPVSRQIAVRGLPVAAPPARADRITLTKTVTDTHGAAVDLQHLTQNTRLAVTLTGQAADPAYHATMLVDLLPAGWEIERVVAPGPDNGMPWLGALTTTRTAEKRDDRFMAAIDLNREKDGASYKVAYIVRVVSPGRFVLPAASIGDMYNPAVQARTEVGSVTIAAAR